MLAEILHAQSGELVELLDSSSPDLGILKKIALQMHLSTDTAVGLTRPMSLLSETQQNPLIESNQPVSVQTVVDLCAIAARHRLKKMNLKFEIPPSIPVDLFVKGNPWELAYALFFAACLSGQTLETKSLSGDMPAQLQFLKSDHAVHLHSIYEADFIDLLLPMYGSLSVKNNQTFSGDVPSQIQPDVNESKGSSTISESEWTFLQRLLAKNNGQLLSQKAHMSSSEPHTLIIRLPTFPSGFEEPHTFKND